MGRLSEACAERKKERLGGREGGRIEFFPPVRLLLSHSTSTEDRRPCVRSKTSKRPLASDSNLSVKNIEVDLCAITDFSHV